MSVNMKNSLRLDRRFGTEDDPVIIDDGRLDNYAPGHSTPKRAKNPLQEPPSQDYRVSPILLTQDSNNEVAWDWQSPKTKIRSKQQQDASNTPRRTRISYKKRNSNSPLVYKPSKKRIMKCEDIAKIDEWKKEFLALDAQIETVTSHETSRENVENNISDEIIFDDDFETEDNAPVIVIEDTPPGTSKNTPEKSSGIERMEKESLEDLFDDSINDESMLRCSQEIEAKLSLQPASRGSSRELKRFGLVQIPPKVSSEPVASSTSSSASKFKKYKSDPINKNSSKNQKTSETDFKITDLFDDDFEIPDDSFDEIVLTMTADAAKYEGSASKAAIVNLETKNSNSSGKSNVEIGSGNNCGRQARYEAKSLIKSIPVPPPRSTNQQKGSFNGNSCASSTQMSSSSDKKFFRSRNRSDTSLDGKGRFNSNGVSSGVNWSNKCTASSGKGTVSTEIMDIKRTNSCMDRRQSVMSKENNNCSINNFDRLRVNDDGNVNGSSASASRSQTLCTPEEIEKKRLEAKMRLEAKRKMQNFAKSIKR